MPCPLEILSPVGEVQLYDVAPSKYVSTVNEVPVHKLVPLGYMKISKLLGLPIVIGTSAKIIGVEIQLLVINTCKLQLPALTPETTAFAPQPVTVAIELFVVCQIIFIPVVFPVKLKLLLVQNVVFPFIETLSNDVEINLVKNKVPHPLLTVAVKVKFPTKPLFVIVAFTPF